MKIAILSTHPHSSQNREVCICEFNAQYACVSIHQSALDERKYLALYSVSALRLQLSLLLL